MKEILNIGLEQQALSLITNITYGNVMGWFGAARKDLKMDLIVPKTLDDHAPCPCVIWICGGAFMTVDRSVWMPELMPFAKAGFVVASVEYRTSNEAQFPAPLIDIKSAVRFLKAHADNYCIDPNNIFIMGESAGGTLACLAGVTMGDKNFEQGDYLDFDSDVKGVIDFYGLTDITRSARKSNPPVPFWAMEAFIGENFAPRQQHLL